MDESYLVIRADVSSRVGTGHLMRCLALGQAWRDTGGQVVFITACSNEQLLQRLYHEGFGVHRLERPYPDDHDWQMTRELIAEHPDSWLVLDGYHFDSAYQQQVKKAGYLLLVIDDTAHCPHYYADIVLNQNIHANSLSYSCEPYTRLLLGTKYVLLRREFLKWRGWKREIPETARKVLVTLGGSDPNNVTLRVIQALRQVESDELETVVVVGENNPHFDELQPAIRASRSPMRVEKSAENISDLMAWADVALSAGGSTCWELAFMGLPSLVLALADNQRPITERLDAVGVAVNLGWHENLSSVEIVRAIKRLLARREARAKMTRRGQELVDNEGTGRVLAHLRDGMLPSVSR